MNFFLHPNSNCLDVNFSAVLTRITWLRLGGTVWTISNIQGVGESNNSQKLCMNTCKQIFLYKSYMPDKL